jgi:hypothetical protein
MIAKGHDLAGPASGRGDEAVLPRWIILVLDYHAALREALAVKRWLVAARRSTANDSAPHLDPEALLPPLRRWLVDHPQRFTPPDDIDSVYVQATLSPPQRRLSALVWERLAARHGMTPDQVKTLLLASG